MSTLKICVCVCAHNFHSVNGHVHCCSKIICVHTEKCVCPPAHSHQETGRIDRLYKQLSTTHIHAYCLAATSCSSNNYDGSKGGRVTKSAEGGGWGGWIKQTQDFHRWRFPVWNLKSTLSYFNLHNVLNLCHICNGTFMQLYTYVNPEVWPFPTPNLRAFNA